MKKAITFVLLAALSMGIMACSNSGGSGSNNGDGGGSSVKMCVGTCTKDADCGTMFKCGDVNGMKLCVMCLVDSDCTFGPKACDTTTHICKICSDTEQTACLLGCNTATGQCKQCDANDKTSCTTGLKECDTTTFICVACKVDSDCGTGEKCLTAPGANACWHPCTKDADCEPAPYYTCDTGTGLCNCKDDASCKSAYPSLPNLTWTCQKL